MNINFPPVIFGTSALGNLFVALDNATKLELVNQYITHSKYTVVFDSAGKYGAGLALEALGDCLKELKVEPGRVIISNKLGWLRVPLLTDEPTFERGVWKELKYDAVQKISYDGIIECFEQGNNLLNRYIPQMVSIHDPDEYLATATTDEHKAHLYNDILEAYKALVDLKREGRVTSIGVGAKDWRVIEQIAKDIKLDWVMIANSLTLLKHPTALLNFTRELSQKGVAVINAGLFHSGFLVGSDYFDYKLIKADTDANKKLFTWRDKFFSICNNFSVPPAEACVQFGLHVPGVVSVALNTSDPKQVLQNVRMGTVSLPKLFWKALKDEGLIDDPDIFLH